MSFVNEQTPKQYVEVAYLDNEGIILGIKIEQMTIQEVLLLCDINYEGCEVGVNGKKVDLMHKPMNGDRIEVYPPLRVDPKKKRRHLIEHRKKYR